jgi:hypothetical protein
MAYTSKLCVQWDNKICEMGTQTHKGQIKVLSRWVRYRYLWYHRRRRRRYITGGPKKSIFFLNHHYLLETGSLLPV